MQLEKSSWRDYASSINTTTAQGEHTRDIAPSGNRDSDGTQNKCSTFLEYTRHCSYVRRTVHQHDDSSNTMLTVFIFCGRSSTGQCDILGPQAYP